MTPEDVHFNGVDYQVHEICQSPSQKPQRVQAVKCSS